MPLGCPLVAMLLPAKCSEELSGVGFENAFEGSIERLPGPPRAGTSLLCQDLGSHLGNTLVFLHGLPFPVPVSQYSRSSPGHPPVVMFRKYAGRRSRSYQESAIVGPCDKPWSCHNASV